MERRTDQQVLGGVSERVPTPCLKSVALPQGALEDGGVQLPYVHRVSKYDPVELDVHGHYTGAEDTISDHGEVEAAYLQAFAADAGIDRLSVREPEVSSLVHFGVEAPLDGFGLGTLLPGGLAGFHDGAEVSLDTGVELVRLMLRDSGAWCRLEAEGAFAVHVGWDQYLYVGSSRPCHVALARTRELGLFPERLDASPYDFVPEEDGVLRPGDDDFWAGLHGAVACGRAGLLEEVYVQNASRWHRLTSDTIDTVRAALAPRARLAVWPDLSSDIAAVLEALPAEGLIEGVWQGEDGQIHSAVADKDELPELAARIAGADAAALLSVYADDRVPLFSAVVPDSDGVVRARWQAERSLGDLAQGVPCNPLTATESGWTPSLPG
ncbi:RNA-binding protein [Streptomyces sp. P9-A4]|uniref:RNA-binding protein n=1 Tax=Streptomyces sp. P9-A4 TaxID=3072285 RepID=UPI002FC70AF5